MQPALDRTEGTAPAGVWTYRDTLRHVMRDALRRHPYVVMLRVGVDDRDDPAGSTRALIEEFGHGVPLPDAVAMEDASRHVERLV